MSQFNTFYSGYESLTQTQESQSYLEPHLDVLPGIEHLDIPFNGYIEQQFPVQELHQYQLQNLNEQQLNLAKQTQEIQLNDFQQVIKESEIIPKEQPRHTPMEIEPPSKRSIEQPRDVELINVTPIVHENINGMDVVQEINLHESKQIEEPLVITKPPPQVTGTLPKLNTAYMTKSEELVPNIPENRLFEQRVGTVEIGKNKYSTIEIITKRVDGIPINRNINQKLFDLLLENFKKDPLLTKNNLTLTPENATIVQVRGGSDQFSLFLSVITTLNAIKLIKNDINDPLCIPIQMNLRRSCGLQSENVKGLIHYGLKVGDLYSNEREFERYIIKYEKDPTSNIIKENKTKQLISCSYEVEQYYITLDDVNINKLSFISRSNTDPTNIIYFRVINTSKHVYYCITSWYNDDKQFEYDQMKRKSDLLGENVINPYILYNTPEYDIYGTQWKRGNELPKVEQLHLIKQYEYMTRDDVDPQQLEYIKWVDSRNLQKEIITLDSEPELQKDFTFAKEQKIRPNKRRHIIAETIRKYEMLHIWFTITFPIETLTVTDTDSRSLTKNEMLYLKTMITMFTHLIENIKYKPTEWTPDDFRLTKETEGSLDFEPLNIQVEQTNEHVINNDGIQLPPIAQGYQSNIDQTINDSAKK